MLKKKIVACKNIIKVLSKRFHYLNGRTIGFWLQTQLLEPAFTRLHCLL